MPYVEVNNHKLHYADSHPDGAPSKGQNLIFIHGLGSSQNFYHPVLPYLTPSHRCITLDTYGSGRSEYTGQPISIDSIAQDAVAVLDKLQIQKATFIGHSMGGLVVLLLGAKYADRVEGISAIGPILPSETLADGMTKRAETVLQSGMEPLANSIPYQATGSKASVLSKSFIRELILNQNPKGYAALCQAIANAPTIDYSAIRTRFQMIVGEEDKYVADGVGDVYKQVAAHCENRMDQILVGHWYCVEDPDLTGKIIAEFVNHVRV